jgi:hypothetical protein
MNTCRMRGMVLRAMLPTAATSTGTSRQPTTCNQAHKSKRAVKWGTKQEQKAA